MEYLTFISNLDELPEAKEVDLVVKDLTPGPRKYEARYVKAVVSRSPESMPSSDTLWIRFSTGLLHPKPWAIRIVEELAQFAQRNTRDSRPCSGT